MKKEKRNLIASALLPGLGQLLSKHYIKAITFMMIHVLFGVILLSGLSSGVMYKFITLGEKPEVRTLFKTTPGDNSLDYIVNGSLFLIILSMFIVFYIFNMKDSIRLGKFLDDGNSLPSGKEYYEFAADEAFVPVFLTPGALGIVFIVFFPMLLTILIAFTNYSGPDHLPPKNLFDWVGFRNFENILKQKELRYTFFHVAGWTLVWAILTTVFNFAAGLLLALLTNSKRIKFKGLWRGIFILPYAIPSFVSLLVFRLIFNGMGPINVFLHSNIPFLTDATYARTVAILVNTWVGAPYFMVLIAGALTNISSSLYEASDIDGANKWQQFKNITFPMLWLQLGSTMILTFAFNFNNFGAIYLLTNGNPADGKLRYAGQTDILVSWIYKLTIDNSLYSLAATITIFIFLFVATISLLTFARSKTFNQEAVV
ncbi:MAG: sugar ABC transporter permease [Acetoanaerobium sp.]|jgi:arabinogalactan oligomer/maltooligosaccharide transport system permease protein|nr:sugar ABC transporter permease [Acetoanaerobium sp.]MBU9918158.1 sugar ABC transporter permease [Fusobacteriaceae bacterium]